MNRLTGHSLVFSLLLVACGQPPSVPLTCESTALDCGSHGVCVDDAGAPACACDEGYGGTDCRACADGHQDNDGDGVCEASCARAGLDCGEVGSCSDASGEAQCVCDPGHAGDRCTECAPGLQDNDMNGTCLPTCATSALACGDNGACSAASGTAPCVCATGYAGELCESCATGYQDHDGDGTCSPDCATAGLDCGGHGACEDASGTVACACEPGYAGAACDTCAAGFQDHDTDGVCAADCLTAGLVCGDDGACEDLSGAAVCACETGYAGASCDTCAEGFQDHDGDGVCSATCATAGLTCEGGRLCADDTGTATCTAFTSCEELAARTDVTTDGEYTLFFGGHPNRPWTAYCHALATAPATYLTLPSTAAGANVFSSDGQHVTTYRKVRIDAQTLRIDIKNWTFATFTTSTPVDFAVAAGCGNYHNEATIDLRGTALAVNDAFGIVGYCPWGAATPSAGNQVVLLFGGGGCGGVVPAISADQGSAIGCGLNHVPNGGTETYVLQLEYFAPATCADVKLLDPAATDGEYALFVGGEPDARWTAYCHDMEGTPTEYLSLPSTAAGSNTFASDGQHATTYTKVRLHPETLRVEIRDRTFATFTTATPIDFSVVFGCGNYNNQATIDLRGTEFAVNDAFGIIGYCAWGGATPSEANQVVALYGGGGCGGLVPAITAAQGTAIGCGLDHQPNGGTETFVLQLSLR